MICIAHRRQQRWFSVPLVLVFALSLLLVAGLIISRPAPATADPVPLAPLPGAGPYADSYLSRQADEIEAETKARRFQKFQSEDAKRTENMELYDVGFYDLDLQLDPDAEWLTGTVTVVAAVIGAELVTMELHLNDNMSVLAATAGGAPATFTHGADILTVTLDRSYATGETVTVVVNYEGNPESSYFGWDAYGGADLIWTLSEPYGARDWWPCKDLNTDKADSVDLHIQVPQGLIVASNGTLVQEEIGIDSVTYHWQERYPIVTYLVSLAIHPYTIFSDWYEPAGGGDPMEVRYYVIDAFLDQAQDGYAIVPEMIGAFAEGFGEYPFIAEKYGHAHFPWGGAMEHQTCTSFSMYAYGQGIISHELAHQWWGDMITCADFHHIWLNEGFATWSEAYWYEQSQGMAAYHNDMANNAYFGSGTIFVEDPNNFGDIFNGNLSYRKASWVVHMLRHVVGEEDFFAGLAEYREQYGHSSATTEQFQAVMEGVSGMDLEAFFQQWIYGEYYPRYRYAWNSPGAGDEAGTVVVQLRIDQIQTNTGLFTMPLDVHVTTDAGVQVVRIDNSLETEFYTFTVDGDEALQLQIDPENWVLKTTVYFGSTPVPGALPSAVALLPNHPNPFNPQTTLAFDLPQRGFVRLEIYDLVGRRVRTLLAEERESGQHSAIWDGRADNGGRVSSGTYVARLVAAGVQRSQKLMLVK